MHVHLRIHRWVIWWFYVGVICGAVAIVNILGHNLTGTQDRIVLMVGVAHWLFGGAICWAFDGVKVEPSRSAKPLVSNAAKAAPESEWHPASDFLLPGGRHSLLPWRH